jgi:hypothetical protein
VWRTISVAIALGATTFADPRSTLSAQLSNPAIDAEVRAALVAAARGLQPVEARFEEPGLPPVDIHLWLKPAPSARRQRTVDAALLSMRVFSTWYGVAPASPLVIVDVPLRSHLAGASYPGVIAISSRWMAPARDRTVERSLIGAMARQYLFASVSLDRAERWFDEAFALYTGTRGVHEALENDNPTTLRFFDGHVPVVVRPVPLTPNRTDPRPRVRHFDEIDRPAAAPWRWATVEAGSRAQRGALALHTLERYIGWPAMQQALREYHSRATGAGGSLATLASVVSEQRGNDLSWFFAEAFRPEARFDYAVLALTSEPAADGSAQYQTTVVLQRNGDAVFAGTGEVAEGRFASSRGLPVWVSFEDGSLAEDWWNGRDGERRLEYLSRSQAASASVDPRAVLLLDEDRANNTKQLHRSFRPVGARLALHWIVWLQDLVLSCTALA